MTEAYPRTALTEALRERDRARERYQTHPPGKRGWRAAEADYQFWQGRAAFLLAAEKETAR